VKKKKKKKEKGKEGCSLSTVTDWITVTRESHLTAKIVLLLAQ
jgi:hypothetical protein